MRVRNLSSTSDWTFGNGVGNYAQGNAAIGLDINMSLRLFLGECFFATNQGMDWFTLLGGKSELAIQLAVNATILNVNGVTGLVQTSVNLDPVTRNLFIQYSVQTVYSVLQGNFSYDIGTVG
jgi:hypothetical protein